MGFSWYAIIGAAIGTIMFWVGYIFRMVEVNRREKIEKHTKIFIGDK